jgi:hypothetical protein
MSNVPIEEDPDVNGLVGKLVTFFVKGNLQKTAGGFVTAGALTQSEADQLVSGGMVLVKVVAYLQANQKPPVK